MQSRLARALPALVLVAAIGAGCSSSSNNSVAPQPLPGPNFSFAFPTAGSVAVPGTSNKQVFTAADTGSWSYRCNAHVSSGMTGTINVVAGPPVDSALVQVGAGNALVFSPSTVTIHAGGYVRWINVSTMTNHTVTRQ